MASKSFHAVTSAVIKGFKDATQYRVVISLLKDDVARGALAKSLYLNLGLIVYLFALLCPVLAGIHLNSHQ